MKALRTISVTTMIIAASLLGFIGCDQTSPKETMTIKTRAFALMQLRADHEAAQVETDLIQAIENQNEPLFQSLVNLLPEVEINRYGLGGKTALEVAVQMGLLSFVEKLCEHGAYPLKPNQNSNVTPLEIARTQGPSFTDVLQLALNRQLEKINLSVQEKDYFASYQLIKRYHFPLSLKFDETKDLLDLNLDLGSGGISLAKIILLDPVDICGKKEILFSAAFESKDTDLLQAIQRNLIQDRQCVVHFSDIFAGDETNIRWFEQNIQFLKQKGIAIVQPEIRKYFYSMTAGMSFDALLRLNEEFKKVNFNFFASENKLKDAFIYQLILSEGNPNEKIQRLNYIIQNETAEGITTEQRPKDSVGLSIKEFRQ